MLQIIFPDTKDVNIKPLKKSQVTITGTIDGVYRARQQLIVSEFNISPLSIYLATNPTIPIPPSSITNNAGQLAGGPDLRLSRKPL